MIGDWRNKFLHIDFEEDHYEVTLFILVLDEELSQKSMGKLKNVED